MTTNFFATQTGNSIVQNNSLKLVSLEKCVSK